MWVYPPQSGGTKFPDWEVFPASALPVIFPILPWPRPSHTTISTARVGCVGVSMFWEGGDDGG